MWSMKYASLITTCTVFIAFIAMILQAFWASNNLSKLTTILHGLIYLENSNSSEYTAQPHIAIGYGSCSDLFVPAIKFLNYSNDLSNDNVNNNVEAEYTVEDITSEEELLKSFGYYFRNGAASERYTSNQKLFRKLIAGISKDNNARWALGGNAPVMGMRFFREGAKVLLAAQMTEKLRKQLPVEIQLTGDPIDYDDIHLIMEYKTDEQWGPFTAPRANRYILHNDQNNPTISSLEPLDMHLNEFNARLFVISGLQMLDSYPFPLGIREKRLAKVRQQIISQPLTTLVHFEMASFVEIKLLRLLRENVIPYSDSIGMNEQELDNLQQVLSDDRVSFASESNPRVATALQQMRKVFRHVNNEYLENIENDRDRRMLTRIHVHTLAYQAILVVHNSQWKNVKNAAAKASLTAHRHVCGTNIVNPESSVLILDESFSTAMNTDDIHGNVPKRIIFNSNDPVSCWNESISINPNRMIDVEICVAPVLVCKVARQTVGAGDNISAAGLILQI